jgi:group I intron endonuclease
MVGIYKITSPSGKVYIGQSIDIEKRFKQYKRIQNVSQQKGLYNSFLKYGVEKHSFEFIEECSINLLNERERYWQDFYNVIEKGLNCFLTNTYELKRIFSTETREKMSKAAKGKKLSDETKLKISLIGKNRSFIPSFEGFNHSEESKNKISNKQKGFLNHNYNKKASKETKKKMSLKSSGKNNGMYGKKHSKETILKIQKNRKPALKKNGVIVLNIENGIFYSSIKEASIYNLVNYQTLFAKLNGKIKNNTNLICC